MSEPRVDLIPVRPAVCADQEIHLDLLVRIVPPAPEVHFVRPRLNLALVLDRSGSMAAEKKMDYARKAAAFAVEQLLPNDSVSVIAFDDQIDMIVPAGPVTNKAEILRKIATIGPRGSTALHAGWEIGARQTLEHKVLDGLNRVLLLSDGLANVGLTDPTAISGEVAGMNAKGVSTTTLGVGDDYNEDLMEAMARYGDGNYYFISDPVQLADIFQTELQGLVATLGTKVTLGYAPAGQSPRSVTVSDFLNDLPRDDQGRWNLPNLVVGNPILGVLRLRVPAQGATSEQPVELGQVRIAWDEPGKQGRPSVLIPLRLPIVTKDRWDSLGEDVSVQEQVALLMATRAKREAIQAYDRGDVTGAARHLEMAVACCAPLPASASVSEELANISELKAELDGQRYTKFRKMGTFQAYQRTTSKPSSPPPKST